jgi:dihydroorotase
MFDLPTCLSKFMLLGMTFEQTIEAATARPARIMGLQDQVGTLRPGALADVALFRIERGDHTFYDVHMNARRGQDLVRNTLTLVGGRELAVTSDGPQAPWIELSEDQRALVERGHTPAALGETSCCGC